jgi:hypothetical protein
MKRVPNSALARHMREAAWSDKGTARRVNEERLRRGRPTGYGGANVRGRMRGVVPDPLTREVIAFLLSSALGRRVTQADLGFAADADPRTGLVWHDDVDGLAQPRTHHLHGGPCVAPAWVRYFSAAQMHDEFAHVAAATGRHADTLRFASNRWPAAGNWSAAPRCSPPR